MTPWSTYTWVDYYDGPLINGLWLNGREYFALWAYTKPKGAMKLLFEKLPREKATETAERLFFQKWERKFAKEELKKQNKQARLLT